MENSQESQGLFGSDESAFTANINPDVGTRVKGLSEFLLGLAGYKNWVCYRFEWSEGKDKPDKIPYQPNNLSKKASTLDPSTWASYDEACAACRDGQFDGIGFVLTGTKLAAFDIDGGLSRSPTGELIIDEKVQALIDSCNSYVEITPSGIGLRVIGYGRGDPVHTNRSQGSFRLEIYRQATRFITVTCNVLPGYGRPLVNIDEIIDRVRPYDGPKKKAKASGDTSPDGVEEDIYDTFEPREFADDDEREEAVAPHILGLIRKGVPRGDRSEVFQSIVGHLRARGFEVDDIVALMDRYPTGIASKYRRRLKREVQRSWDKAALWDAQRIEALLEAFEEPVETEERDEEPQQSEEHQEGGETFGFGCWFSEDAFEEPQSEETQGDADERAGNDAPKKRPATVMDPWTDHPVPSFPLEVLPPAIRTFVEVNARAIGCDPAGLAMACLATLSGAIDHCFGLQLKKLSNFTVSPCLWIALIGGPSLKKSPALSAALDALMKIDGECWRAYQSRMAAYRDAVKGAKKDGGELPSEPKKPPRYYTTDATIEAHAEMLAESPRYGILLVRDELAGWIGSMDRYSGAKSGASSDRAYWLTNYDGKPYRRDRVKSGSLYISVASTAIVGGIQPGLLPGMKELTADGLLQRFLPVMIQAAGFPEDIDTTEVGVAWRDLVHACSRLQPCKLRLTDEAVEVMTRLHRHLHDLERAALAHSLGFQGFVGKLAGVTGRLALVLHIAENAADPYGPVLPVTVEHVEALVRDYLLHHAVAFYDTVAGGEGAERIQRIASYILTSGKGRITASEFTSNVRALRNLSHSELLTALSPLVVGGWLAPDHGNQSSAAPPRAWLVNRAEINQKFAERKKEEEASKQALASLMGARRRDCNK